MIDALVERTGWMLVHSVWQGAGVALLLGVALTFGRRLGSLARYTLACSALATIVVVMGITFALAGGGAASQPEPLQPGPAIAESARAVNVAVTSDPRQPLSLLAMMPWVTWTWLAGVCAIGGSQFAAWVRLQLLRRRARPADATWAERFDRLMRRVELKRATLLMTDRIDVPIVLGVLRQAVLAPVGMLNNMPVAQVEAILAHELAHIRRCDYLVNLIQTAIETLLFYHPAVWWIGRQIRREREHCCDEQAAGVCGSRPEYARALAALEASRRVRLAPAAAGGGRSDLLARVQRLLSVNPSSAGRSRSWLVVAAVIASCFAVGLMPDRSRAQTTAPAVAKPAGDDRRAYRVVVYPDRIMHAEQATDWKTIEQTLAMLPEAERRVTRIELAAGSSDLTVSEYLSAMGTAGGIVERLGLSHLSQVGLEPGAEDIPPPGEYYMGGAVKRSGVYSITGRKISLRQAIIAAGGVEDGADFVTILRRAGGKDQIVLWDASMSDILQSKAPDVMLWADDTIMVSKTPHATNRPAELPQPRPNEQSRANQVSPDEIELRQLIVQRVKTEDDLMRVQAELRSAQNLIARGETPPAVEAAVQGDPTVARLQQQVDDYDVQTGALNKRGDLRAVHQLVAFRDATQQKLDDVSARVRVTQTAAYLDRLRADITQTQAALDRTNEQIRKLKSELVAGSSTRPQ